MLFAVGVFIGCVAGLVAALALSVPDRIFFAKQTVPIIIALVALVVGSVALVESTHTHNSNNNAAPAADAAVTTVPPTAAPPPASSTPTTAARDAGGYIQVPNVMRLSETNALSILSQSGLQANIDTISLANVPSGFVMSQSPLPGSSAPPGTTVNLQISARA